MTLTSFPDAPAASDATPSTPSPFVAPDQIAEAAGLRYVCDRQPGIRRKRWGRGFRYFAPTGDRIQDAETLDNLKALPIPPSWEDVWICPDPRGHLVATGRDAKGRKQYRYHPKWRDVRQQNKFDRLVAFGQALPSIRAVVERRLRSPRLSQDKLLAIIVYLLESTLIRVGNEAYRQENDSFGLTTLRDRHVELSGSTVQFHFVGKSGVEHEVTLSDRRLARAIKRCQELPGQELFQYVDEAGMVRSLDSADVNDFLQRITDTDFTSKDFRTWAGTVHTATTLIKLGPADSPEQAQTHIREAIAAAAQRLGNRVATCRNYYVHPAVLHAYEEGWLHQVWPPPNKADQPSESAPLSADERSLLAVLQSVEKT